MKNPTKYFGNELKYLSKVLESEHWSSTSGTWNSLLENSFCEKFESEYAIAMNSGTSTLHSALYAVGVRPGDEVISPALSVIMNTTSTIHCGAIPVYADIDRETFNIDPDDLERKITTKTKAIQIVHLYGLPCDMDRIMDISNRYGIPVIEDCAQCFLSKYNRKLIGSFGSFASYSFENSKHMSCGEGGILTTNNEKYATSARKFGNHGFKNSSAKSGRTKLNLDDFQKPEYKRHDQIGWNYRLSEFLAAITVAQLEKIDDLINLRIKTSEMFLSVIKDTKCDYLIPQKSMEGVTNSYWAFSVLYEGLDKIGVSWKAFRKEYVTRGGDGIYASWSVPYLEPIMSERKFVDVNPDVYSNIIYKKGSCPVAEEVQPKIMQFKNNYRSLDIALRQSNILKDTINFFKNRE